MDRFYEIISLQSCYALLSLSNKKIAFYLPITDTASDALHNIHILFFDLFLALYYFVDIALQLFLIHYLTHRNLII